MTYQISWYVKPTPGPGRRALVGTERFDLFADAAKRALALLNEGLEVRVLPLKAEKLKVVK
jgi:hypothetical protein